MLGLRVSFSYYRRGGVDPRKDVRCVSYLDPAFITPGLVASTPDLGTLGGNWTQSNASFKPTLDATAGPTGGPCLVWDGARYLVSSLASSSWAFLHASNATIFQVFRIGTNPNKQAQIGIGTSQKSVGPGTRGIALYADDRASSGLNDRWGQQVKDSTGAIADYLGANNSLLSEQWMILETVITAGSGISTYKNGTLLNTTAFSRAQDSGNPQTTAQLYGGIVAGSFVGSSTHHVVFNAVLSSGERSLYRNWLGGLNGISVV